MCRRQFLNINSVGVLLMLLFFQVPDVLPLPPKWRRAVRVHMKKQSHSNIYMLHQYSQNFSSPWVEPATPIINFVETKKSLLTHTGFWRSQTVLFTREFLCYQTEKAKSKNKLSWRQMPHLSIMLNLSRALLSPRDFIFFWSTKLQPGVWLPPASLPPQDAAGYFTTESCSQKLR